MQIFLLLCQVTLVKKRSQLNSAANKYNRTLGFMGRRGTGNQLMCFKQKQAVLYRQETHPRQIRGVRWCAAWGQVATDSLQISKQQKASKFKHIKSFTVKLNRTSTDDVASKK